MDSSNLVSASSYLSNTITPLLNWYRQCARILPWRMNRDPYRILVSEIMLQQTRVDTVKPYFEKFMRTFPTLNDLAYADEMILLKCWEGLGYYQRARNLQKTARIIVEEYQSVVPKDYSLLLKLPGIGEYTAGSIASIAYDIPVPAVDGNVLRVLSRILNSQKNISESATKKLFRQIVQNILPLDCPGTFNQAIMELGATICLPRNAAQCLHCPISSDCLALKENRVAELPVKEKSKAREIQHRTLLIFLTEDHVLLKQRPAKGLLSKLWEYPNFEEFWSPAQVREQLKKWEISRPFQIMQLPPHKHIFSHLEWRLHAYLLYTTKFSPPPDFLWVSLEKMNQQYALPSAFQFYTSRLLHWNKQFSVQKRKDVSH